MFLFFICYFWGKKRTKLLGFLMERDSCTIMGQFLSRQECSLLNKVCETRIFQEHVYMRPEVNLNRFEISNHFDMSLFTWHFTWRFHCGNFPNNSKTLLHMCK